MKAVRKRKRWRVLLLAVFVLAALFVAISGYRPFDKSDPATAPIAPDHPLSPPPVVDELPGNRQTFLVMGVEAWEGEYGRSDSMIVVSYDPREQRLAMLSIPRDLMAEISGYGYDKINHAHSWGGPDLAVDTVERLLGLGIDHWVSFSFDGFIQTIDALGGVELNPTERLYHVDPDDTRFGPEGFVIDIQPGRQVMDGRTALEYARFRADAEGDLGRMRRQQEVIQAVVRKAASPAILSRASQLIPAVYKAVGTDLTVGEILKLATTGRDALSNPIVTGTLDADELWLGGTFYFAADLVEARSGAYELLVGEPPAEDFLEQARRDNERYQAYVAEQVALAEAAASEAEKAAAEQEALVEEQPTDEALVEAEPADELPAAIHSVRIVNRKAGVDVTLSQDVPGDRPEIERIASLLNGAEWLDDGALGALPLTPPGGKPEIIVSYADGGTVSIEHAYRCQPETDPPQCQRVNDAVVIDGRPARSAGLAALMGGR